MGFCEVSQKRVSPDFRRRHQDASAPRPDSAAPAGVKYALCSACLVAAFVILIWGMTFANTRALLEDFSALEILVGRFGLAWVALWGWEICPKLRGRDAPLIATASRQPAAGGYPAPMKCGWRDEWLFAAMGFCGIFCYQFLENCAIYYTNASNVAIFVSFGPIVTAALARAFTRDRSLSAALLGGSLIAIVGVALVSMNGVVNLHLRPIGDLMALGAMVSWGFYSILIGKANEKGYPPSFAIRKAFGWSLVMMLPLCVWGVTDSGYCALDGSFSVTFDWTANVERFSNWLNWLNLGFLGLLASAASFAMWNYACNALGVVRATIGLYLTPIVGIIFAALFLGERPTPMSTLGGVVIIIGVAIANWRKK